jgi:alpha-D-xyloside xylohydrolase
MFRSHGTDTPREIWRFGEPGEPLYDALAKFLNLRYRLLPYIYSLAGWTTQRAYTPLRALPFDFRHDPAVYEVGDQFMFGPAFLVCPVTRPMYYAPGSAPLADADRTRSVYLPAGADWFDFWTDRRYAGGQTVNAAAPLEVMPLFVRAGSIVPMGPQRQFVDDQPDAPVDLHIYPGSDGHFELYEDEGDSYQYEAGAFATIAFHWCDETRQLVLGPRSGQYPGMQERREFRVILHAESTGLRERCVAYDGTAVTVGF